ncbi:hypothetical protein AB0B13_18935 [Streptomyces sp. NPDC042898]|uniref:hypothetical protein n=1 Tax=Streptomyces sp. NPDC042898 TaxID=3154334 RepID=UPI0033D193D9
MAALEESVAKAKEARGETGEHATVHEMPKTKKKAATLLLLAEPRNRPRAHREQQLPSRWTVMSGPSPPMRGAAGDPRVSGDAQSMRP